MFKPEQLYPTPTELLLMDGAPRLVTSEISPTIGEELNLTFADVPVTNLESVSPVTDGADIHALTFLAEHSGRVSEDIIINGPSRDIYGKSRIRLLSVGSLAYVELVEDPTYVVEQVYSELYDHAAYVAGMSLDTPLRWQEVHGMTQGGGMASNIVSRYVMGDFGDGRKMKVTRNYDDYYQEGKWKVTYKVPVAENPEILEEVELVNFELEIPRVNIRNIRRSDERVIPKFFASKPSICLVEDMVKILREAQRVLPDAHYKFMEKLDGN